MELTSAQIDRLARHVRGEVVRPDQPEYASALKWFIGRLEEVRPAAVVRCADVADVVATLAFVRDAGVPFAVRSGFHSFADYSTSEGLVLDLRRMDEVRLDPAAARVTVGSGTFVGPLATQLAPSGLVVPIGWSEYVGVAGASMGGGFGPLTRYYGLGCDHLRAAEVVLADGRVVRADERAHADLLWALRGAGAGNFGVVTSLVFQAHPAVPGVDFSAWWRVEDAAAVIDAWQRWAPTAPDEINAELVLQSPPDLSQSARVVLFGVAVGCTVDAVRGMLADVAAQAGCTPRAQSLVAVPADVLPVRVTYAGMRVGHAPMGGRPPEITPGVRFVRSDFFNAPMPAAAVDELVDWFTRDRIEGQLRELEFIPWGGAYARVRPDETAFVHRAARFLLEHTVQSFEPELAPASYAWVTGSRGIVQPFGNGHVYQNYPDRDLTDWAWAYYGDNLPRLQAVKAAYDPENLFSYEQSIPPAVAGPGTGAYAGVGEGAPAAS